jgi:hypothetical protein
MNRLRRSGKWLSLWLLVAMIGHFAFDHREASAFVLCFGADGHVAVERAGHDHRTAAPHGPDQVIAGKTVLQNADVPCVDIPVVSDDHGSHMPFPESGKGLGDAGWTLIVALSFFLLPLFRTACAVFRTYSPPLLDSRILLRRSVVLLN